jgi:hypothetical protein
MIFPRLLSLGAALPRENLPFEGYNGKVRRERTFFGGWHSPGGNTPPRGGLLLRRLRLIARGAPDVGARGFFRRSGQLLCGEGRAADN